MVAALAGLQTVGVFGVQGEVVPPVLERHASARHHDAGAKAHIVGLDVGDHVALPIGAAQIDGSAFGWDAMRIDLGSPAHLGRPLGAVSR